MSNLVLSSPLKGWISPLDEVVDAVFSGRMLGDGVAIDPLGSTLHAPCDGEVVQVSPTRHAITLRTRSGAEILMHLGLETVALKGQGFEVHVADGQVVLRGDPLISFDLDALSLRARSLITPVIVSNSDVFRIVRRSTDSTVAVGDFLMELEPLAGPGSAGERSEQQARRTVTITLAHGLHARPSAKIAQCAREFTADVSLMAGARQGSAKSPVGLMTLALRLGDVIEIVATGVDAEAAVEAVADLIESGMGERAEAGAQAPTVPAASQPPEDAGLQQPSEPGIIRGVTASPGLAIGQAVRLLSAELSVPEAGAGETLERAALTRALDEVRTRISAATEGAEGARRSILSAHLAFLEDPELSSAADILITSGKSAGFAWRRAVGGYVEALRGLGDRRMAERVDDLIDLERQVLRRLTGEEDEVRILKPGAILLADELLPSQLMGFDTGLLAGICTARGGPTSHVAILAASMGIPALVAAGPGVLDIEDGAGLILDAEAGLLRVAPDAASLEAAQSAIAARHERRALARASAHQISTTRDGHRIEVFANVGALADAVSGVANGAEGCGLLRTEFLFLERETPPDEHEQARQYQAIASALDGRPLIIRTLDVGGDKAAPYLPIPAEENPALGLRGVRVSLWRPHLLKAQIRAILSVRPAGQCKIMVPMIASLDELRAVRLVLEDAKRELGVTEKVELGVMIETPAAAVTADLIAAEADFLSIGTNDLTQYVLAMDRGNPEMAARIDALHPAVLRMIAQTCAGAQRHSRWVGVCGGAASDLVATPLLLGLGVTELSASAAMVPDVKALVRRLDLDACRRLAAQALSLTSPEAVRDIAKAFLVGVQD